MTFQRIGDWFTKRRACVGAAMLIAALTASARAQSGAITLADARIHYEVAGTGPAVVFIHGWALNLREWDDQMSALSPQYRVVAYDRRGFGKSTGFADVSADPGDLRELLDTLGIRSAILVGHSQGAEVAYRFAAAFPTRVDALVQYPGPAPAGFPVPASEPNRRPTMIAIARQHGLDSARKFLSTQPGFRGSLATPEVRARIDALWAAYSGRDLLEDHSPSGRFPAASFSQIKQWRLPILFVVGDSEAPRAHLVSDSLARWLPNARKVVIPGGGHGVHFEQPARFNAVILSFLAEVAKGERHSGYLR